MKGPRFFNTLTRRLEPLETIEPGVVRMYTCGPTVYDYAHIGNFRAYIFEDLLQRHLEARGYRVRRVMNLTDVDDKTIRGSRSRGVALMDFTRVYKEAFFTDLERLRIRRADYYPEATDERNIERMIEMIRELERRGHAYRAEDGSVYFRIRSFERYGRLAGINLAELKPGARVSADEYEKEEVGDFALWKAWTEADGPVWWDSPWGRGRPGWHIECSAMATGILGDEIDIHCGGEDNIFPHHEAEIAQCECVTGKRFVRMWMHCRHLLVGGKKMSKSEGNFFTLRDLLGRGWSGREVRYALLAVKYREPLNFTEEGLEAARSALARYDEWSEMLSNLAGGVRGSSGNVDGYGAGGDGLEGLGLEGFWQALDDDLNISEALAVLFQVIRRSNRMVAEGELSVEGARRLSVWRNRVEEVLAIEAEERAMPKEVLELLAQREEARRLKDWKRSDELRNQIGRLGWEVRDTREGQVAKPTARVIR